MQNGMIRGVPSYVGISYQWNFIWSQYKQCFHSIWRTKNEKKNIPRLPNAALQMRIMQLRRQRRERHTINHAEWHTHTQN